MSETPTLLEEVLNDQGGHKKLCVFTLDPEWGMTGHFVHRAPINCTTVQDLWNTYMAGEERIKELEEEMTALKAKLYDFEHD